MVVGDPALKLYVLSRVKYKLTPAACHPSAESALANDVLVLCRMPHRASSLSYLVFDSYVRQPESLEYTVVAPAMYTLPTAHQGMANPGNVGGYGSQPCPLKTYNVVRAEVQARKCRFEAVLRRNSLPFGSVCCHIHLRTSTVSVQISDV